MSTSPLATVSLIPSDHASSGSMKLAANQLTYGAKGEMAPLFTAIADALQNGQKQIDQVFNVLRGAIPTPSVYQLLDPTGKLIAQIGNIIDPANNKSYPGIWAIDFYAGGGGPSNAGLIVDSNGNVTVSGTVTASGLTSTGPSGTVTISNGVITDVSGGATVTISNGLMRIQIGAGVTLSYGATGIVTYGFAAVDAIDTSGANQDVLVTTDGFFLQGTDHATALIRLDAPSDAPRLFLAVQSSLKAIQLDAGAVGGPFLFLTDGVNNTHVYKDRVDTPAYLAGGTPGIDSPVSPEGLVQSYTVNTNATGVFGTPGAGQSNGTVVTGVSITTTPTTFKKGIRTA